MSEFTFQIESLDGNGKVMRGISYRDGTGVLTEMGEFVVACEMFARAHFGEHAVLDFRAAVKEEN